ncbi:uncharacterized protein Z520_02673 [Fonsecaea multimorphosa CBS 102226]|uniref:Major facilitator superfamily (MFS) profile domain-containing protein n=1 Tax=Fonsecaea multimorphosa CBS 102226 TaxID=1442371 RepID=A0A0D2HGS6_9EURO|nr:uncharacterized protein Z520_02673 [Fonsecaea multimorphosa CBS 102226]KIY01121.1 hypothetical protein Z520_02673 [Fonsecaea multimorphosa CBS 102226]OAL28742.1 hypothetical protein AYO22_02607 [Fonsecaea multimorphosa]
MGRQRFLGLRGASLTAVIVFVAGCEFLLFGYDQGVFGGIINLNSFTSTFPSMCTTAACVKGMTSHQKSHRSTIQGVSVACYNIGCLMGALSTFRLGNVLGRRKSIFIGCCIVSVGAILQASSFTMTQLIIGRIICGVGTGINTATMPVWQAECTKPHQRGPIMAFETSLVPLGVMTSYWVDFGFSYAEPSQIAWRFPVALQLVFALVVLCLILSLPESPRWLLLQDRWEEATEVLSALYDAPAGDVVVAEELASIRATIETQRNVTWKDVFHEGPLKTRSRTILAVSIQIMSQFTGINVITYYATSIFQNEIGLSPFMSRILSGALGTDSFISGMISVWVIKTFDRRNVMMFNLSGMTVSMVVLAVTRKFTGYKAGIVATVFLFVFKAFFALGFAQIPWIYPAEITPLATRVQANAISTATNWVCVFTIVMIAPIAFNNIGWKTYLIFASCNVAALFVVFFFYPETRNRSLEEIDLVFHNSTSPLKVVMVAKRTEHHFGKKGEVITSLTKDMTAAEDGMVKDLGHVAHVESIAKCMRG